MDIIVILILLQTHKKDVILYFFESARYKKITAQTLTHSMKWNDINIEHHEQIMIFFSARKISHLQTLHVWSSCEEQIFIVFRPIRQVNFRKTCWLSFNHASLEKCVYFLAAKGTAGYWKTNAKLFWLLK